MKIERFIYKDLRRELGEPQILVLSGPRQVGKTTLLRALEESARSDGKRTRFFDLEQPADLAALAGEGKEVIEALTSEVDVVLTSSSSTNSTISRTPAVSSRRSSIAVSVAVTE